MPRTPSWLNSRNLLTSLFVIVGLLAILPPRVVRGANWFWQPVTTLMAPIQGPLRGAIVWLKGRDDRAAAESPQVAELQRQRDEMLLELNRTHQEIDDLRRLVADLQHGIELNPGLSVRQIVAPVIGAAPDLSAGNLTIKAGSAEGVEANAVAVVRGVHLVGRIAGEPGLRSSHILPITDKSSGPLRAVIMLDATVRGPTCELEPTGHGTLRGPVADTFDPATQGPSQIKVGMTVRLFDPNWPGSASMLEIGAIQSVEPAPEQPLRQIVTVLPVYRLDRVSEVTIRLQAAPEPAKSPATTPSAPR